MVYAVGGFAGQAGTGFSQFVGAFRDAVFAEVSEVRAERVGFDTVDAGLQVGLVDLPDHVGPGDVEDLVTPLVSLEVVHAQVVCLKHRSHRPVGDEDAGTEDFTEGESSAHRPTFGFAVDGRTAR